MRINHSRTRNLCAVISSVSSTLTLPTWGDASTSAVKPAIDHDRVASVPNDGFPQVEAVVESDTEGEEIRKARACFRAEQHPDFYCVDMKKKEEQVLGCSDGEDQNVFVGVLPMPEASTAAIVYYIEATDDAFVSERTAVHTAATSSDPVGLRFSGTNPEITVIATVDGSPEIPPGFRDVGIAAFMSVGGALTSVGGGIGTTAAVGTAAAVGAAAAGVGVLVAGSESTTTTTIGSPSSTPTPSTTTTTVPTTSSTSSVSPSASARACFTTMPTPAVVTTGTPVRFDASCSTPENIALYEWDFGDGRSGENPIESRVFNVAGVLSVTLTIELSSGERDTRVRSVVVEDPNEADIRVSVRLVDNIPFQIMYGLTFVNAGPKDATENVFEVNILSGGVPSLVSSTIPGFSFADCLVTTAIICRPEATFSSGATWLVTIRVNHLEPPGTPIRFSGSVSSSVPDPIPGNNIASISTPAALTTFDTRSDAVRTSFTSQLEAVSTRGVVNARVLIDQLRADTSDNGGPFLHPIRGNEGLHIVEGFPLSRISREGRWRFDFHNTKRYVPGSLRVESGDVISLNANAVVFRLSVAGEPRIKFTYRLAR